MSIQRVPDVPFAQIANEALRDKRLSFKARGILALALSNVGEWQASRDYFIDFSDRDGREAVQTALNELTDLGYRIVTQERTDSGRLQTIVSWHHIPAGRESRPPEEPPGGSSDRRSHGRPLEDYSKNTIKEHQEDQEHSPADAGNVLEIQIPPQPDLFDEFWKAYPRHGGSKKIAREGWAKAIKKGADPRQVIDAARAYSLWLANHPDPPKTKYAQGWLTEERWESDLPPYPQASSRTQPSRSMQRQNELEQRIRAINEQEAASARLELGGTA